MPFHSEHPEEEGMALTPQQLFACAEETADAILRMGTSDGATDTDEAKDLTDGEGNDEARAFKARALLHLQSRLRENDPDLSREGIRQQLEELCPDWELPDTYADPFLDEALRAVEDELAKVRRPVSTAEDAKRPHANEYDLDERMGLLVDQLAATLEQLGNLLPPETERRLNQAVRFMRDRDPEEIREDVQNLRQFIADLATIIP